MKISLFFFISDFNYGGASNSIFNFLKNLDSKKFRLFMIFVGKSDYKNLLPKNINIINIKKDNRKFSTIRSFFKIKKIIINETKKNSKNVFISNIHYANIISIYFLNKILNLKLVVFERTSIKELDFFFSISSFIKNKVVKFLLKIMYKKADLILTNSKIVSKELLSKGLISKVIYSATLRKILPKKKFKKKTIFNIIAVGRLTLQKDYLTILKSINEIKKNNFKLKIYGDGYLKKDLENYIKLNNLNKKIEILGHEKNKKKIYTNADLLIHSAIFEGLPNCLVEAINYSVPIIASKGAGGTTEVLQNGAYGSLFNPRDYKELAYKINDFLEKPTKLQQKIHRGRSMLTKFTITSTTNRLEKIIYQLFSSNKS